MEHAGTAPGRPRGDRDHEGTSLTLTATPLGNGCRPESDPRQVRALWKGQRQGSTFVTQSSKD